MFILKHTASNLSTSPVYSQASQSGDPKGSTVFMPSMFPFLAQVEFALYVTFHLQLAAVVVRKRELNLSLLKNPRDYPLMVDP